MQRVISQEMPTVKQYNFKLKKIVVKSFLWATQEDKIFYFHMKISSDKFFLIYGICYDIYTLAFPFDLRCECVTP